MWEEGESKKGKEFLKLVNPSGRVWGQNIKFQNIIHSMVRAGFKPGLYNTTPTPFKKSSDNMVL